MKRLFCLLLSAFLIVSLCSCAGKKDKDDKGSSEDPETKTTEENQTGKIEEIVTAPDPDDDKNDGPAEIGTLPIIFDDEKDEQKENGGNSGSTPETTSSETTPPTSTKKPTTTTKKPDTNTDTNNTPGVVETPIIPFN